MPGSVPARCTFPDDFLQDALDTVRRRTVAVQVVQRYRLVLLFQEQPRRPSEYSSMSTHAPWIPLGFGLVGQSPTLGAHCPPQHKPALQERRQIFRRLCVKHISCHSADTFSSPRNRNVRIPRADLI